MSPAPIIYYWISVALIGSLVFVPMKPLRKVIYCFISLVFSSLAGAFFWEKLWLNPVQDAYAYNVILVHFIFTALIIPLSIILIFRYTFQIIKQEGGGNNVPRNQEDYSH